ncbi:hypothetical protein TNCV_3370751 [Trichonephila clavipes]|nr:hypothetical protein TNCV_3370751 [Trichonephila clavipes]
MSWRYGILRDLYAMDIRGNLPVFIKKFLNHRSFQIPSSFKRSQNQKFQGPKHPQSISKYSLGSRPNILASPLQSSDLIKTGLWICGLQFCVQISFEDLGSSTSSRPDTLSWGLPYITGGVPLC